MARREELNEPALEDGASGSATDVFWLFAVLVVLSTLLAAPAGALTVTLIQGGTIDYGKVALRSGLTGAQRDLTPYDAFGLHIERGGATCSAGFSFSSVS